MCVRKDARERLKDEKRVSKRMIYRETNRDRESDKDKRERDWKNLGESQKGWCIIGTEKNTYRVGMRDIEKGMERVWERSVKMKH